MFGAVLKEEFQKIYFSDPYRMVNDTGIPYERCREIMKGNITYTAGRKMPNFGSLTYKEYNKIKDAYAMSNETEKKCFSFYCRKVPAKTSIKNGINSGKYLDGEYQIANGIVKTLFYKRMWELGYDYNTDHVITPYIFQCIYYATRPATKPQQMEIAKDFGCKVEDLFYQKSECEDEY